MQKMLKVRLKRSKYGRLPKHAATLKGLGLNRVRRERELPDTPATRGMINKVSHLVEVIHEAK